MQKILLIRESSFCWWFRARNVFICLFCMLLSSSLSILPVLSPITHWCMLYIPKTFLSLSIVRTRYANEVDMAATRNDDFPLFCSSGLGFNNRTCTHIDRHSLIYVGLAPTTHLSSHYSYFGCNFWGEINLLFFMGALWWSDHVIQVGHDQN